MGAVRQSFCHHAFRHEKWKPLEVAEADDAGALGNTRAQRVLPGSHGIRRLPLSAGEDQHRAVPEDVSLAMRASELIVEGKHARHYTPTLALALAPSRSNPSKRGLTPSYDSGCRTCWTFTRGARIAVMVRPSRRADVSTVARSRHRFDDGVDLTLGGFPGG